MQTVASFHLKTVCWWMCVFLCTACTKPLCSRKQHDTAFSTACCKISVRSDQVAHLFSSVIIHECTPDEIFQPVMDVLPSMDPVVRHGACIRVLQKSVRFAVKKTFANRKLAMAYCKEQSSLLKEDGRDVSPESLMSDALID